MPGDDGTVRVSIVVPVYNSARELEECLAALTRWSGPKAELIVVDDASTDESPSVAARFADRVVRLAHNSGPAAARNEGARHARGDVLFFVDADVVVAPGVVGRIERTFADDPNIVAVFGSYDATPRARGHVSRYRNLLHHFVHQTADVTASTFWAGCGAVRREVFEDLGGFDAARFRRPSIEDIEFGTRLCRAGHRVVLDKGLQGTHLKRWTLVSMIRTDVRQRAIPWSRLVLQDGNIPSTLNLTWDQRVSAALVAIVIVCVALALVRLEFLIGAGAALAGVLALNRKLYALFLRHGGLRFAGAGVVLHLLYFVYSALSYAYASAEHKLKGATGARASTHVEEDPLHRHAAITERKVS